MRPSAEHEFTETMVTTSALKIALTYGCLGVIWILFSDYALMILTKNNETITRIQIYKGWAFVLVTGILVYFLTRNLLSRIHASYKRLADSEQQLKSAFQELRQSEEKLEYLNAVLLAMRHVNQLIVGEKDREALLQGICHHLIQERGYAQAWIIALDAQGTYLASAESGFHEEFVVDRVKDGDFPLCVQRALSQGEVISVDFPHTSCVDCPFRQVASILGILIAPLTYHDQIYGVLSVSVPFRFVANAEAQDLFRELSADVAYALHALDLEEQRQKTKQALRESEIKYRLLTETTRDMILVHDMEGVIQYVNRAGVKFSGYQPEDYLHASIYDFVPPDEIAGLTKRYEQRKTGEKQEFLYETKFINADGRCVPVEVSSSPIIENQKVSGVLLTARDITRRKQAEEALIRSETMFRKLFEDAPIGIALVDSNGMFLKTNRCLRTMLAYSEEELLRLNVWEVTHPDDIEQERTFIRRIQSGEAEFVQFEKRYLKKDGDIVWGNLVTNQVIDQQGNFLFGLGMVVDITEQRRAKEALKTAYDELELRVQERTKELENARMAAETANRAKSDFLANMSHELRTPLNGILGYAQIFDRASNLTPEQRNGMKIVQRSGEHLLTLITDILDLSKIEAGKIALQPTEFHLHQMLENLMELIGVRARQKQLQLEDQIAANVPFAIYGDEKRLRQILFNLLGNAVKFTEHGAVTLRVTQVSSSDAISRIRFHIEDTGIGIPEEKLQQIFEPFYQLSLKHRPTEGTGLGLAISQRLVREMGGELTVRSLVNQGTSFAFELDLPVVSWPDTKNIVETPVIIGYKGRRRKILIVDDHPQNRAVLRDLLRPLQFELCEASDGQDAIERALAFLPDVILMDVVMPGLNGIDATRRLRRIPAIHGTVIIIVSASVFESNRQEGLDAGGDDFLMKPVSFDSLLDKLEQYLHLDWIVGKTHFVQETRDEPEVVLPPVEELEVLTDLAKRGSRKRILTRLDQLEQMNPECQGFVAKIRELAINFQLDAIWQFVEKCQHNEGVYEEISP